MRTRGRIDRSRLACHVCKTYLGEIAEALDDVVNNRRLFPSYAAAVGQAVLEYHRRLLREDLQLRLLKASGEEREEDEP